MPKLSRGLFPTLAVLSLLVALPCSAQVASDTSGRFLPFLSLGSSQAQRLPDGLGFHGGAGVVRALGTRFSARLEATYHAYGEVPVYPCLFQDAERCYSTVDRTVAAGLASLVYELPIGGEVFYLVGGAGLYRSHRVATQNPACDPISFCSSTVYKMSIRATQPGVSGGAGTVYLLGTVPVFVDVRLHFVSRTSPEGGPSNDYFLLPITVSLRF